MKKRLEELLQDGVISPSEFKILSLKRNKASSSQNQSILGKIISFFCWFFSGEGDNFSKRNIISFFLTIPAILLISYGIISLMEALWCDGEWFCGAAMVILFSIVGLPILLLSLAIIGYKKNNVGIRNGIIGFLILLLFFLFYFKIV